MSATTTIPESARQAFAEMQQYLSDEIAPILVADAAELLMGLPARYGAEVIQRWVEGQLTAPDRVASVAGYVYHAVKKFQHLAEVGVVDQAKMSKYVSELSRVVVRLAPEREQTDLRLRLSRVSEVQTTLSPRVHLLNREVRAGETYPVSGDPYPVSGNPYPVSGDPVPLSGEPLPDLGEPLPDSDFELDHVREVPVRRRSAGGRFKLMMGRFDEVRGAYASGTATEDTRASVARLVARAAFESGDAEQLRSMLTGLQDAGVGTTVDRKMFGMMADQIPDWAVMDAGDGAPVGAGNLLQAMQQMVVKSPTREEGVERFGEMVYAAIDQLNEGHLAQAIAMFDAAQRLIDEKKIDAELAHTVKCRAQVSVSLGSLRQFASAPAKHGLLRKVLWFFPAFSPQELLARLDGEPKRETRKLILSIIEVHGPPCRRLLFQRLMGYLNATLPDPNGHYSRNIVFLLRRIPRGSDEELSEEFELLRAFSHPDRPFMVTKEAVGALATVGRPQAEALLVQRLGEFERMAVGQSAGYNFEETSEILDRTCAALVSLGTLDSVRHVVKHTNLRDPKLGDTFGRVRFLAATDLTQDPELLANLIEGVRKCLPKRVLGVALLGRSQETLHLVTALSGTHDPHVVSLYEEIVKYFPGKPFADEAAKALEKIHASRARDVQSNEVIAGDIELFGLPTLLQSLSEGEQTGRLRIATSNGQPRANMIFRDGKIASAATGQLTGLDAVAQLIERPIPGTFRFERISPSEFPTGGVPMDVLATVLEAIRRHDEFQEDRALVPEGSSLMLGSGAISTPEDEEDAKLVKAVWREAAKGTAPQSCEEIVGADAFRVRRLYAHWLETGALKRRAAA